jgi:xanthine dehydrogenase accessory factor
MDSTDLQVLNSAVEWLEAGRRVTLATVARTWGSSPRPAGAWAAIRDDGALAGSVSGGCVEDDLLRRVREGLGDRPMVLNYGATPDEAARFGLPCGGTLQLVLEPNPDVVQLKTLRQRCADGLVSVRTLDVINGRTALEDHSLGASVAWDGCRLATVHGPRLRLLVIGAGQVSTFLAPVARSLDYEVTVCDPREAYYREWHVEGVRLVTMMPDDAVLACNPDSSTAIVALTHDPKLDDMALLEALRSKAFYVGALGSRATTTRRKERLSQHFDLTTDDLARLHGPVGLSIGSRTPPEIAIAILAELIAVKNLSNGKRSAESAENACAK